MPDMDTTAEPEGGIARPRLSYAAIAEQLLAHRLAQPDLAPAGDNDKTALSHAFRRLAPVFALDHAAAAGEPPRAIIAVLAAGLVEAIQAGASRILLKSASGALTPLGNGSEAGDRSGGLAAEVAADGRARASGEPSSNLACAALTRQDGEIVGVLTLVDKRSGPFDEDDLVLAAGVGAYIAELAVTAGLLPWLAQGVRVVPRPALASAGDDAPAKAAILSRILAIALEILAADRGWILLYDPTMDELYTALSEGLGERELRIGAHDGIAGATFRTGELTNIPLAYQDPRFDPSIDWQIGYRTRNILCAPIFSADGQRLGVLQVVNKQHGSFDAADESHLRSLASQMGVTLDYTQLFDQVLRMKSHNESMLRSLTNGVLTIDMRGEVTFANQAALATLRRSEGELLGQPLMKVFGEMNAWILEAIDEVANGRAEKQLPNSEFYIESRGEWVSANISLLPLLDSRQNALGFMLVIENLEGERELRRTMSRYLSNEVIDRLMQDSGEALGGTAQTATTLFSDIRGFTTLSEQLGAARHRVDAERILLLHGRCPDQPLRRHRQICRRRHHGGVRPALRRGDRRPEQRPGGVRHAAGARAAQRPARGGRRRHHPHRRRHRHGHRHRRQYRLAQAHGLHRHRRRGEPCLADREHDQALRRRHPDLRRDAPAAGGNTEDAADRRRPRARPDAADQRLRGARASRGGMDAGARRGDRHL